MLQTPDTRLRLIRRCTHCCRAGGPLHPSSFILFFPLASHHITLDHHLNFISKSETSSPGFLERTDWSSRLIPTSLSLHTRALSELSDWFSGNYQPHYWCHERGKVGTGGGLGSDNRAGRRYIFFFSPQQLAQESDRSCHASQRCIYRITDRELLCVHCSGLHLHARKEVPSLRSSPSVQSSTLTLGSGMKGVALKIILD